MKRVYKNVLRYKKYLIIASMALIINIILDMFNPYFMKLMVDDVVNAGRREIFIPILYGIIVITAIRAILGYVKEFYFDYLSTKVNKDLKHELFDHIQSMPFSYFDRTNTGELMSRISEDIDNIWRIIGFGTFLSIENVIYFTVGSAILFYLNWKLALISLSVMPIIAKTAFILEKKLTGAFEEISDQGAKLNTTAQENIAGVRLVKAFARERHEILKFLNMNKENYDINMKQYRIWGKYFPLIEFLTNLSVVLVVSFGGYLVIGDDISIGDLVAFNGYLWMLIWPMRMIGWLANLFSQASASAKKIYRIIDNVPDIKNSEDAVRKEKFDGRISFRNVSLKYDNEEVLKGINLEIKEGLTVAIMGKTGSGKSSLVNLVGRYYDVSDGEVLIDGINVKNLDLKFLRKRMSVVSQDIFLFSDSIKENVALSKEDASTDEILNSLKSACIDDFINELPENIETVIGERGIGLSGGQKQRIAIARALIRDFDFLILDDATSALDMETEYQLLKNIKKLKGKSTIFIIAHRISAVKNADLILFMEEGKIVEVGNHETLLNKKGRYYEVYCEQFKDFELEGAEVI